ncbi:MAG: nucleotidyltransferase domain-containing protein [Nitrospinae bacterium]|nr:nucleotidyltransferase domain-containing protein [Nitrospinota bacterium]
MISGTEKIKKILRQNPDIEFAYLFGSRAKGSGDKRSDWDIAIYFNKAIDRLPEWRIFYLEAEISKKIGGEVQVIPLNNLDSPIFLFQVINNGLILVDNKIEKRILYEAGILNRYHDWHYFLRRHIKGKNGKK